MTTADLPAVNAALNAIAAVFLCAGLVFIRRKQVQRHRFCMVAAFAVSVIFLLSYVTYHALHGSTRFQHAGPVRSVYFSILITHIVLAASVPPLAIITLRRALRGDFPAHRRIARWTWPIWMYVSVTGVVVYLMLYQWPPGQ
ncbi:MAG: DUF420 domain-containing protein [Phycisphaerales bacterium]|nr:DUF420 domain-containing protein [Phycisphaerales bacterium]